MLLNFLFLFIPIDNSEAACNLIRSKFRGYLYERNLSVPPPPPKKKYFWKAISLESSRIACVLPILLSLSFFRDAKAIFLRGLVSISDEIAARDGRRGRGRRGCSRGAKRLVSRQRNISPLIDQFRTKSIGLARRCQPAGRLH